MRFSKMFLLSIAAFYFFSFCGLQSAYAVNFVKGNNGKGRHKPGPSGAPEPQMIYLMGMAGLAGIVFLRRRQIQKKAA